LLIGGGYIVALKRAAMWEDHLYTFCGVFGEKEMIEILRTARGWWWSATFTFR
jgi:hypothetical protein